MPASTLAFTVEHLRVLLVGKLSDAGLLQLPALEEYRILRALGQGAMGRVFLARDTLLDRTVAIKFLLTATVDAAARERFYVEARAIARLSHPNVVAIHRVGEIVGQPYLVSEYVHG